MKKGLSLENTFRDPLLKNFTHPVACKQVNPSISHIPIGEVNTPLPWAVWAAERYGLVERWIEGATIMDPTMGEGNLLEAFLYAGIRRGISVEKLPLRTLYGIERRREKIQRFFQRMKERYGVELVTSNFIEADILLQSSDEVKTEHTLQAIERANTCNSARVSKKIGSNDAGCSQGMENSATAKPTQFPLVDILFGNPPWITFASLPEAYKDQIKGLFLRYSLVKNKNQALLGRSRVDLSALIVLVSISRFLRTGGNAVFFLPLSLFFGEGAGEGFRNFRSEGVPFWVQELVELPMKKVFQRVSTRGGLVSLKRDEEQRFPVPVYRMRRNEEIESWKATPIEGPESSWVLYRGEHPFPDGIPRIALPLESFPRQGINTCGANDLFFFDSAETVEEGVWKVSNPTLSCLLPSTYLFPLLTSESFREKEPVPQKWVFLPYQLDGRPLTPVQIEENPYLAQFMLRHKVRLEARKGVLIHRWIRKGYFWALLGVGAYCFYPWKVVWEAAGRKAFVPRLWKGVWQANQSLFGYLPFQNLQQAERVLEKLQAPQIEAYLLALQAQGTLNWAQPGRMRRLFTPIPT